MLAIQTKTLPASHSLGHRVKAISEAGNITLPWDHKLHSEENHRRAAEALLLKLGWSGEFVTGMLPDGTMAHVFI